MPHSRLGKTPNRPPLTIDQILAWSNDFFAAHGCWPNVNSGMIPGTIDDTWRRNGYRGLPAKPKRSLARLLEMRRGVRNSEKPPPLTTSQIVKWAKQHRRRTGRWPALSRGLLRECPENPGTMWTSPFAEAHAACAAAAPVPSFWPAAAMLAIRPGRQS